jgi:hypothetical protein
MIGRAQPSQFVRHYQVRFGHQLNVMFPGDKRAIAKYNINAE